MIGFFHNLSHFFERGIRSTSTAGIHTAPTHCLQVVVLEAISGTIQQEAVPLTTQQKQQEEWEDLKSHVAQQRMIRIVEESNAI